MGEKCVIATDENQWDDRGCYNNHICVCEADNDDYHLTKEYIDAKDSLSTDCDNCSERNIYYTCHGVLLILFFAVPSLWFTNCCRQNIWNPSTDVEFSKIIKETLNLFCTARLSQVMIGRQKSPLLILI